MSSRATEIDATATDLIAAKRASQSVLNACHALLVLMDAGEPLALGEFAKRAALAPATAHRILRSLALYEFVHQNDDGAYELGLRLLELGSAVAGQFDIVQMARPYLERLAETTGETVHLAVLEGDHAVYVDKVEGRHSIRLVSRPGYSVPLNATSLGKVLCAGLDEEAFGSLLGRLELSLEAEEVQRFQREIGDARRLGYAVDREELLPGLMCVGTPIFDRDGTTLAAMSVAGPSFRMESALAQHAEVLRDAAAELSAELGYVGDGRSAGTRRAGRAMVAGKRIIDLTVPLSPDHPCGWPGHRALEVEGYWFQNPEVPYAHQTIALDEHTGTHFDAPAHFVPPPGSDFYNGPGTHTTTDEIPLNAFMGPARVIDARSAISIKPGESAWIDPTYVERAIEQDGPVSAGDVVLFHTGWSDAHYRAGNDGSRFVAEPLAGEREGWAAPAPSTIALLAELGVRTIGVDTPTLGAIQDSLGPHLAALERGLVVIEELVGLGGLPTVGALFIFLPLKLIGGTGAPGRAIAIVQDDGDG